MVEGVLLGLMTERRDVICRIDVLDNVNFAILVLICREKVNINSTLFKIKYCLYLLFPYR